MPSSSFGHIRHVIKHIITMRPSSVLDVGIGFGRWGFLCREALDIWDENVHKADWKARIDGIEVYEPYVQDHQKYIYDNIYIGDAREVVDTLGKYDMIIIGDMIEHMPKPDGWKLFHSAMNRANMGLIVNVPLGEEWLRETGHDNKYEDHQSWWSLEDYSVYHPDSYITEITNGMRHASFYISKDHYRYAVAIEAGRASEQMGEYQQALDHYSNASNLFSEFQESYLAIANLLIKNGQLEESETILNRTIQANPESYEAYLLLALVQRKLGKIDESKKTATAVLELSHGLPEIEARVRKLLE